jgi:hypothetical protein
MAGQPASDERPQEDESPQNSTGNERPAIDVERLADLVYRLAREEARLARARGARPGR